MTKTRTKAIRRRQRPSHTGPIPRHAMEVRLPRWAKALFKKRRYKVCYGGRGGARSWSFARALLIRAAQQTTRILCTRELQTSIKDSVHLLLKDQIDLMGLQGFTVLHNEIRHENGSVFLFEGLRHNVTKIKSLEGIDICWVEEAERITKESWNTLIPTIRKPGSEIWVTFNPDQEDDATYDRFVIHTPPDTWIKKVSWKDNPYLTPELRAEKDYSYATDPDSAEHVWGGELRMISDALILKGKYVIQEFAPDLGHSSPDECDDIKKDKPCSHGWSGPYQGLDFGFATDPLAAVRCWIHERKLYVEYEVFRVHLELDDTSEVVNSAIPGFEHFVIRADSARPDSISYLKRHGLPRIGPVKKHAGSVEDGVSHLRSYEQIVIHPRCKHTAEEAKRYKYKTDERSGDVLPVIIDKHNHCMDAIRYALEPMIKPRRQVGVLFTKPIHDATPPEQQIGKGVRPQIIGALRQMNGDSNGNGNGTHANGRRGPSARLGRLRTGILSHASLMKPGSLKPLKKS